MNIFTKKADELAAKLATADETIKDLNAKLEALGQEKADLAGKVADLEATANTVADLEAKLTEAEGKVAKFEAEAKEIPAKVEAKVIETVAEAGVAPVSGLITADSDKAPANAAEYIAALAKLEGKAASDYVAKFRERIFGA